MDDYVVKNQKKLKKGITTGSSAAAAAMAAARDLLLSEHVSKVTLVTPSNVSLQIPVYKIENDFKSYLPEHSEYFVVKESGDDPDVTNGVHVFARVEKIDAYVEQESYFYDEDFPYLCIEGGPGIGRVTKEGLEQRVGQPAINQVPRKMIFQAVETVRELAEYQGYLKIVISIPAGVEIAKKTFNERLGIKGGISVLGTTGILEPMSEKAIVDTIEVEIRQRHNQGKKHLLITPGNYGQGYVSEYLKLPLEESVKCSNYLGETFDLAVSYEMETVLLVGNIGKLVKLAAGIMNTHSKIADARMEILALHALLCGATIEMGETIMNCINTEEAVEYLIEWKLLEPVMEKITDRIYEVVDRRLGKNKRFAVLLFSERSGFLGGTKGWEEVVEIVRNEFGK